MKRHQQAIWIGYTITFGFLAVYQYAALLTPGSRTFVYYHTFAAICEPALVNYYLAIASSALGIISLWPLICLAFDMPCSGRIVIKILFFLRAAVEIPGHNYEWQIFHSVLANDPKTAFASLALFCLFLLPSYEALFKFAWPRPAPQT